MGRLSHRRQRALTRTAARIALVLGALTFAGAVVHFSYTAYESSQCYTAAGDYSTSQGPQRMQVVDSAECRLILAKSEEHQRIDAAIAILVIVVWIGAAVRLSNTRRRTRRAILIVEVAVVAVGLVYTVLLAFAFR
jgi:hypothetical protein